MLYHNKLCSLATINSLLFKFLALEEYAKEKLLIWKEELKKAEEAFSSFFALKDGKNKKRGKKKGKKKEDDSERIDVLDLKV